jgi:hypothetical protein
VAAKKKNKTGRPTKKVGKRGGGGAWRSYVRKRMSGHARTISLAKIAEEYGSLDAVQRRELVRIGADATIAHRTGRGVNESSFGPRQSDAQRDNAAQMHRLEWERCRSMSPSDQVAAIQASTRFDDVKSCLQGVRALRSHENAVKKDTTRTTEDAVTKYRETIGKEALDKLVSEIPCLGELKDALRPIPSPLCSPCFQYTPPSASNATDSFSWMASQPKLAANKVSHAVLGKYQREHEMFKQPSRKIPQQIDPVVDGDECAAAGICIHRGIGLLLRHQCHRLLLAIKAQAPVGSAARKQIDDGQIVLRLLGEELDGDETDSLEFYVHIGLMYWSPYRPTFHKVVRVDKDEPLPYNPGRIYVQAASHIVGTATYATCRAAFAGLPAIWVMLAWNLAIARLIQVFRRLIV